MITKKLDKFSTNQHENFVADHEEECCLNDIPIENTSQLHIDSGHNLESRSDHHSDQGFDVEDYEELLPTSIQLGYSDHSILVSVNF